jgi:hypothetical protein
LRDQPGLPILSPSMASAASPSSNAATSRKPWVYALWYAESCLAFAAVWALMGDRTPHTFLDVAAFMLVCGAALSAPALALRAALLHAGAGAAARRRLLEGFLVLAAGGAAAALNTARGWAAIVCILLVGNALWALELESRAAKRGPGVTK